MIGSFYTDKLVIQRRVEGASDGSTPATYRSIAQVKGKAQSASGNTRQGVNKTLAECDMRFFCDPSDIIPTDRILWKGRYFDVYFPNNMDDTYMQVDAKEVV